jgi:hypothetical protein
MLLVPLDCHATRDRRTDVGAPHCGHSAGASRGAARRSRS